MCTMRVLSSMAASSTRPTSAASPLPSDSPRSSRVLLLPPLLLFLLLIPLFIHPSPAFLCSFVFHSLLYCWSLSCAAIERTALFSLSLKSYFGISHCCFVLVCGWGFRLWLILVCPIFSTISNIAESISYRSIEARGHRPMLCREEFRFSKILWARYI